jgi:hypothetical protein
MAGWTRLRVARTCGFCGALVPAEAPIYALTHGYRCEPCASRYFGADPPVIELAESGERDEPGEDG